MSDFIVGKHHFDNLHAAIMQSKAPLEDINEIFEQGVRPALVPDWYKYALGKTFSSRPTPAQTRVLKSRFRGWTKQDHEAAVELYAALETIERDRVQKLLEDGYQEWGDQNNLASGGFQAHWPEALKARIRRVHSLIWQLDAGQRAHSIAVRFRTIPRVS